MHNCQPPAVRGETLPNIGTYGWPLCSLFVGVGPTLLYFTVHVYKFELLSYTLELTLGEPWVNEPDEPTHPTIVGPFEILVVHIYMRQSNGAVGCDIDRGPNLPPMQPGLLKHLWHHGQSHEYALRST